MKKFISLLLTLVILFALAGCDSGDTDGNVDYSADILYESDNEVAITQHTSPDNEEKEPGETETQTSNEEESSSIANEILTVKNCSDLASILILKSETDPAYKKFAETYKGKIIEFNGCIFYMTNHENFNTRYDILISAGDYVNENTANPGPIFKLEDVGVYDLGLSGLYLPDFVKVGSNIVIRAEVEEFNENAGVFELDPVSIEER